MAVLGRLLVSSAERLDLPDLLSIDSYAAGDWKYFLKGMVGDSKPFVLKGFDVIDPNNAIGEENCAIRVADSVVFYPGSSAGSFFHGLQEGHEQAAPLIPELRKNATNYVYLTFTTINTSTDTRAFWDPDKDGGAGGEFTQDINTESVLKVEVNVSVGSFPANTIPVAIIKVGALTIESIKDARHMLFRLGTGGLNPDPFGDYAWRSLPSATFQRTEPSTAITSSTGDNPFQGADKNIQSMKEWMDAVMSKLRELGGTTYWYEDVSTFSVISTFIDSCATAFKSKGRWIHDAGTPGDLTWTEDINLKVTSDQRTYIVRAGNAAPFTGHTVNLADEEVLYVEMVRNQPINTSDQPVQWTAGSNYINTVGGAVGLFGQLKQGDWVKKINDSNDKFLRVEEFYDGLSGGSPTSAANAKSIKLSANYAGSTAIEKARYDQGEYLASDIVVSTKDQAAISAAGGNFHWLATRSDTIQKIGSINETSLSVTFSDGDGDTVKVTSSGAHGLNDGDWINVSGSAGFDGDWQVEVESSTIFYINSSITTPDSGTAVYSVVTTVARDNGDGFQLESANHGLRDGDKIQITGTVSHDGTYLVNSASGSTFRVAGVGTGNESAVGLATLARLIVRTEGAVVQVVQGQTVDIGASAADNMRQYIGMASLTEVNPLYDIPPSYNTLDGMANYNSTINENLTTRVAKLTAMMADKAQDRTMQMALSGTHSVTSTTNGADQDITFNANFNPPQRLDIVLPGSDFTSGSVGLTGTLSLAVNEVAYIDIDRNSTFSIANLADPAVVVTSIVNVPINENILVLAVRLSSTDVWLWNGVRVTADRPALMPNYVDLIVQQNRTLKMVRGGLWSWDLISGQLQWSDPAFIQIPGLAESDNEISSNTITLSNDGDVAYVDINRDVAAGPTTLTVQISSISSMSIHPDRVIIARRIGDNVEIGTGTITLVHGEQRGLDRDSNLITANYVDLLYSSLPTGTSLSIDGVPLIDGDKVLFTNTAIEGVYVISGVGTSLTWTQLDVFGGSQSPYVGSTVVIDDGASTSVNIWRRDQSNWKPVDNNEVQKEPTGFPNRTDSSLTMSGNTFSITPTGDYFDVYQKGVPYRFDAAQSLTQSWAQGLHYIYFDQGILYSTQSFTINIIKEYAFVATMYWDSVAGAHIMLGDERHGLTMDGETHGYLHQSVGARYISGLSAGNFTTSGTGSADTDAQLSISNGMIRDEDIAFNIVDSASPSNPYEQILDPVAEIPIFYRDGVNGDWKKYTATTFPIASTVGAPPSTVVSIPTFDSGSQYFSDSTNRYFAQTFIVGLTGGNIQRVRSRLRKINLPSGYLVCEIYTDGGIAPGVLLGTSDQIDISTIASIATDVDFTFSTPVAISPSTVYWAVLKPVAGAFLNITDRVGLSENSTGSYSGGQEYYTLDGGASWGSTGSSYDFSGFEVELAGVGSIPLWNDPSGPWTQTQATDGNFLAMWLFATNNQEQPIIAIMGQREDLTLNDAQANNTYENLLFGDMPSAEMKVIWRLIFEANSSFSNSVGAALRDVVDLRRAIDTALGPYSPSDHGLLSGLTDQDHPDYAIRVDDASLYTGALKQIQLTDNDDVQKALQSLDKFFGQLRLHPHPSNSDRIKISSSDHSLTNSITLTQTVKSLMMAFNGAEIDFETGSIYESDGVTPLGINFTPTTIPAGEYHWYSIGLKTISPALSNNTIGVQVLVTPAAGTDLVLNDAPRAKFKGSVKLGQIWVQESAGALAPITAANIYQLGVGSGGGSGEEVYDFQLANNQTVPADVVDFLVEAVDNKMFRAEYSIARRYNQVASTINGGVIDATFNPGSGISGSTGVIYDSQLNSSNKTYIGGIFTTYNGSSANNIARINSDGTFDSSFVIGTGLGAGIYTPQIRSLLLDSSEKLYVGGKFTTYKGVSVGSGIIKLNTDGSVDATFNTGTGFVGPSSPDPAQIFCIAMNSSGDLYVGGNFISYNGTSVNKIVKLKTDGTIDATFNIGTGFNDAVTTIAIDSSGKLYVAGYFTTYKGVSVGSSYGLIKLNTDGSVDSSFNIGTGTNSIIQKIVLDSVGHIYVGGTFSTYKGVSVGQGLVKLDSTGTKVAGYSFSPGNNIYDMAVDSSDNLYYCATFLGFSSFGKVSSSGTLNPNFTVGTGFIGGSPYSVTLDQTNNKIYVHGAFTSYNGTSIAKSVRLTNTTVIPAISSEYMTQGSISGIYRPSTSNWTLQADTYTGDDPEVALSITSAGQVQYTSSNLPGTELESMIKFKITRL